MAKTSALRLPVSRRDEPPHFSKAQVADLLEQVGILLQLTDANVFRVRAYQNASRILGSLEDDLWDVIQEGNITDVKGIGKGIGGLITEALTEGTWGELQSLYDEIEPGMIEMLGIPGLGPKRIKVMHDELGVESIADLSAACESGAVADLDGFGEKSQQKLLDGIELLARFKGRRRLNVGLLYGEAFEAQVANIPGVS